MSLNRHLTGRWEVAAWFEKNKHKIALHPSTMMEVKAMLKKEAIP